MNIATSDEEGCWITSTFSLVRGNVSPSKIFSMKILRAIGFGLVIIMLQLLVPRIYHSFEDAIVATFNTATAVVSLSSEAVLHQSTPKLP